MSIPWFKRAACLGSDPDVFFGGESYAAAKQICATCPVAAECLAAAVREEATAWGRDIRILYGYRGGSTPNQRKPAVLKLVKAEGNFNKRKLPLAKCHRNMTVFRDGLCAACFARYSRSTVLPSSDKM